MQWALYCIQHYDICVSAGWLHKVQWVLCTACWTMDMTGVYACLSEACVTSQLSRATLMFSMNSHPAPHSSGHLFVRTAMASIHNNFACNQVGWDTQKRRGGGKPETLSSCRNSLDLHWSASARLGRRCASVPHLRYLSVEILMNRRHYTEMHQLDRYVTLTPILKTLEVRHSLLQCSKLRVN